MKILHVTDFHLDNVDDTNEHLRKKFYKEYITELADKIHSEIGTIDYIFCTGDFINKNRIENFKHAKIVIEFLAKMLKLKNEHVCICQGNHDFNILLDEEGKHKEARIKFEEFRKNFAETHIQKRNEQTVLYKFDNLNCLSLDSTWNTGKSNIPRTLSTEEVDEIINDFIIDEVDKDKPLIVLSHYPMVHFNRSVMYIEDKEWEKKHEWKDAYYLVERIYKLRQNQHTIYLFGDGHIPDFMSYSKYSHFIMSAMFGCGSDTIPKKISREAKIIDFEANEEPTIYTYKYNMRGYGDNPQIGDWKRIKSKIRLEESNPLTKLHLTKQTHEEIEQAIKTSKKPIVISTSIQNELINKIAQQRLYSLGRYATSNTLVSLGWIYTDKLLSDSVLLTQIINRINKWFEKKISNEIVYNKTAFIGIDFWGAILSSQVSIKTNVKSFCIASKAGANHHTYKESVNFLKSKKADFNEIENIILFTDVIASGETIKRKKDKIEEVIELEIPNWYVISIIADEEQDRKSNLDSFVEIVTFCSKLRTPIMRVEQIPPESIVPPRLDLRVSEKHIEK